MTRDEIIRMAREAGLHSAVLLHLYDGKEAAMTNSEIDELRRLEHFARAAYAAGAAAEREACAKVCEAKARLMSDHKSIGAEMCAAAIRARGQK